MMRVGHIVCYISVMGIKIKMIIDSCFARSWAIGLSRRPGWLLLGHTISGMSKDAFLVSQEDDVISTDVAKKGELTHYRWCVSPSLCTCQAPVRIL